ncbi:hypothetical protein BBG47_24270 [Paenibacillus sp. KS1]|uniref:glycosyltransferase family 4 protein n=1 Tax=Paenibacillus sp. KS1 TaxID=1849249 RepID=UPI0008066F88|nr:glycosyltransferase family 1 protein [Paenibacillus sp. KS1]OBY76953.1 hypothetical protein BBG47_24270 [Paenibacillus sp. KS1]
MRVCLDGQPLLGNLSGIGRYTLNLYYYLAAHQDLEITLGFNRIAKNLQLNELPSGISENQVVNNRYPYKAIRKLLKPNLLYRLPFDFTHKVKYDVFHGTNFTYMPIQRGKQVVSIHDLAFMKYPQTTSKKIYNHHMKWVPYCAQNADHIITISEATKIDITQILSIHPDKITVTPLAAEKQFAPMTESAYQHIYNKYQLPEEYILFVGTIEARKNLLTLVKAYHYLINHYEINYKLVVVGARGWKTSSLFQYVQEHQLQEHIIFTGYIDDVDLPAIYNGAKLLTMPSWYEGFGLPLIEAMRCGIPVIGSNTSSIPEVIGEQGLLCDPNQPEEWAENIHMVMDNASTRRTWSDYSLRRASLFTWEHTAEMTAKVYRNLL